jgi:hypothetical protein
MRIIITQEQLNRIKTDPEILESLKLTSNVVEEPGASVVTTAPPVEDEHGEKHVVPGPDTNKLARELTPQTFWKTHAGRGGMNFA